MIRKDGKYPANARVDIDYSKRKPKIKFAYPGKNPKKDAIKQAGRPEVVMMLYLILVFPTWIMMGIHLNTQIDNPTNCSNFSIEKVNNLVLGYNITCDDKILKYKWETRGFIKEKDKRGRLDSILEFILVFWIWFAISIALLLNNLITRILIKKKWYQKWLPKANAEGFIFKTKKKKYKRFTSKDLFGNVLIIPNFSNVELTYKTKGDFSKYLSSLKIREYRKRKINMKTKKKSKETYDNFKWYAVFIFNKIPKTGYLEVIYQ